MTIEILSNWKPTTGELTPINGILSDGDPTIGEYIFQLPILEHGRLLRAKLLEHPNTTASVDGLTTPMIEPASSWGALDFTTFTFDDDNPLSFVNVLLNLQPTTFTFDDDNPLHFDNATFNLQPTSIAKRITSTSYAYKWGATISNNHALFKAIIDNNMCHETGESSTLDGLSIKIERSKHGEHTTTVNETTPSSLQDLCPRPHLQVFDPSLNACHLALTAMGSIPPATIPNPVYPMTMTTGIFEVGWLLRKFKAHIAFSCGTMGSDKLLLLRRFGTPLLELGLRSVRQPLVCPSTVRGLSVNR